MPHLFSFSLCVSWCLPCLTSTMSPSLSLAQLSLQFFISLCLPTSYILLISVSPLSQYFSSLCLLHPVSSSQCLPLCIFPFNSTSICPTLSFPSISPVMTLSLYFSQTTIFGPLSLFSSPFLSVYFLPFLPLCLPFFHSPSV
jgi:hypothetical protein